MSDCRRFRNDTCKGLNCPKFLNCEIMNPPTERTYPPGMRAEDYTEDV